MEDKKIDETVAELIEDLKNKIDVLTNSPSSEDEEIAQKIDNIRSKAIKVFNDAMARLSQIGDEVSDSQEVNKVLETVQNRSKVLYENALDRINELLPEKQEEEEAPQTSVLEEAKKNIDEIIGGVGEEISQFMNREDVKNAVDKTKEGVIDVAEKALAILKDWLTPEREEK